MKIIEALKRVKENKQKVVDLQNKIAQHSANLSIDTPMYPDTKAQVQEWLQSCLDTARDNVELLVRISKTNLVTPVTITIGEKEITKTIAEWVWRRREYSGLDQQTLMRLTDRNLKETQTVNSSIPGGEPIKVTIVRNYDPVARDKMLSALSTEPIRIDAALEVVNAVTDLVE